MYNSNPQFHNHALFAKTEDGRFELFRSLHLGQNGPAGSEYYVIDTQNEFKTYAAQSQRWAECYAQKRVNNRECAPWFGNNAKDGDVKQYDKLFTVKCNDYNEIKNSE